MTTGMLWLDDDRKRSVAEKVQRAADYYRNKYGAPVAEVHAHPRTLGDRPPAQVAGVRLVPDHTILPDHWWVLPGDPSTDHWGR